MKTYSYLFLVIFLVGVPISVYAEDSSSSAWSFYVSSFSAEAKAILGRLTGWVIAYMGYKASHTYRTQSGVVDRLCNESVSECSDNESHNGDTTDLELSNRILICNPNLKDDLIETTKKDDQRAEKRAAEEKKIHAAKEHLRAAEAAAEARSTRERLTFKALLKKYTIGARPQPADSYDPSYEYSFIERPSGLLTDYPIYYPKERALDISIDDLSIE